MFAEPHSKISRNRKHSRNCTPVYVYEATGQTHLLCCHGGSSLCPCRAVCCPSTSSSLLGGLKHAEAAVEARTHLHRVVKGLSGELSVSGIGGGGGVAYSENTSCGNVCLHTPVCTPIPNTYIITPTASHSSPTQHTCTDKAC